MANPLLDEPAQSYPDPRNPRRLVYEIGDRAWSVKRLMGALGVTEDVVRHRLKTWTEAALIAAIAAGPPEPPAIPRARDPTNRGRRVYELGGYGWTLDQLARASGVNDRAMLNRVHRWTPAEILDAINHRRIMAGLSPKKWDQ